MQATQRVATNVNSVKTLANAGCLAQLTKAATDVNNVENQKAATAGLAQMTRVALEGFEEAGVSFFFFLFFIFSANNSSTHSLSLSLSLSPERPHR
jgi:hypothetical protein